ncbi:MAG: hypothetical protein IJK65_02190 [Clostridiales bacterium]|nr:hypothetical protein [Clostridiales bacterium]
MIESINIDNSGYIRKEYIEQVTPQLIEAARKKHEEYRKRGVIRSEYDEDVWLLTNQRTNTYVNFANQKDDLSIICQKRNWDYRWFISCLKTYVIYRLGTCMLETMTTFANICTAEAVKSELFSTIAPVKESIDLSVLKDYSEFVRLVSPGESEYIKMLKTTIANLEYREQQYNLQKHGPCVLNEFSSYFVVDNILKEWRSSVKDQNELYYFFPLYLFWSITTILPLRVNEFCSTPYNCLTETGNQFNLTIRRSRLKGHGSVLPKIHSYSITGDYTENTYEVPKWLFDEIQNYRAASEGYHRNYNLLFSLDFMVANSNRKHRKQYAQTSVFNDESLGILWRDFYNDIIVNKYGYSIVTEQDLMSRYKLDDGSYKIEDGEIMMIQSKHTRHLAMINLVLRGCNPMIVKEFAGHASESMSSHYYTNYANITRTAVMRLFYQSKRLPGEASITFRSSMTPASTLINETSEHIELDNGKCYSKSFIAGNIDDCSVCGGACSNCPYYIPFKKDRTSQKEEENRLNQEIEFISNMLRSPDIAAKIEEYQIRYQNLIKDTNNYATKLWKELEDSDNGTM